MKWGVLKFSHELKYSSIDVKIKPIIFYKLTYIQSYYYLHSPNTCKSMWHTFRHVHFWRTKTVFSQNCNDHSICSKLRMNKDLSHCLSKLLRINNTWRLSNHCYHVNEWYSSALFTERITVAESTWCNSIIMSAPLYVEPTCTKVGSYLSSPSWNLLFSSPHRRPLSLSTPLRRPLFSMARLER